MAPGAWRSEGRRRGRSAPTRSGVAVALAGLAPLWEAAGTVAAEGFHSPIGRRAAQRGALQRGALHAACCNAACCNAAPCNAAPCNAACCNRRSGRYIKCMYIYKKEPALSLANVAPPAGEQRTRCQCCQRRKPQRSRVTSVRPRSQSRCTCGQERAQPGTDVAGLSPVPAQMWQGSPKSPCRCGSGRAQSRRRCGQG